MFVYAISFYGLAGALIYDANELSVFGVPLEVTVQRQQSSRPVPFILVRCAESLITSGGF